MIDQGLILFNVKLSVEIKRDVIEATLLFINNTDKKLYLDGMTLCWDNKIERDIFEIIDDNGEEVTYIKSIKNRIVRPEDYVQLNIGDQFKTTVNIKEAYDVQKGGKYIIQYSTYNPSSYDPDDYALIKIESNKVEITY